MVKIFVSFAFNGKEPFLQTITTEKIYRTEYTKSHKDHRSKKVGWGGGEASVPKKRLSWDKRGSEVHLTGEPATYK